MALYLNGAEIPANRQSDIGALTDNTGQTPDNTIADVAALANSPAAAGDAAERAETNTVLNVIEANISDLADQVNRIRTALRNLRLME